MVKVAVVSDTHGSLVHVPRVKAEMGAVDWLLHAGDHYRDAPRVAELLGVAPERVRAVVGNCDYQHHGEPTELVVELEGVRILLVHGHLHGVKRTVDRIYCHARELGVQMAVFGHSHVAVKGEEGGVLLFNPGSLSMPRMPGDSPSCGLLEITDGRIAVRHIWVA